MGCPLVRFPVSVTVCALVLAACGKQAVESAAAPRLSAAEQRAHCAAVVAKLARYPALQVEAEPTRVSGAMPRVSPARRDTAFTVSFVVDTAGKPVLRTYSVSRHVGTRFRTALRQSVATWKYTPAWMEGCPVPRKVSHTINVGRRSTGRSP